MNTYRGRGEIFVLTIKLASGQDRGVKEMCVLRKTITNTCTDARSHTHTASPF